MAESASTCCLCGGAQPEVTAFSQIRRVTSDVRPWAAGGRLVVCAACGLVQKPADEIWRREAADIYQRYEAYHQSGGIEQAIFDGNSGVSARRSDHLIAHLIDTGLLWPAGHAIDIGCGNGAMLRALSRALPAWQLSGQDIGENAIDALREIPGFVSFYAGAFNLIPQRFDLITLSHSLEHIPDPVEALRELAGLLTPNGILFVQVPDVIANPLDLVVADHRTHFSDETLVRTAAVAGLRPLSIEKWVPKELSLVAVALGNGLPSTVAEFSTPDPHAIGQIIAEHVAWLKALQIRAAELAAPFAIFGTSVASTWIASQCLEKVAFFIDEDPSRIGSNYLGRPVYSPASAPAGGIVLLPLAPVVADAIQARLRHLPLRFIMSDGSQSSDGDTGRVNADRARDVTIETNFDALARLETAFLRDGWIHVDLPDQTPIEQAQSLLLKRLRERWIPDLARLEDYHLYIEDDEKHIEIQHDLAKAYWEMQCGPNIIISNKRFFRSFVALDLHVQKYPYLRIARPGKPQDNLGFHRDIHYGSSPYELSVHIPLTDAGVAGSLCFISGSHLLPDSAFPWIQFKSETVKKGSQKHELGFVYAPKQMTGDLAKSVTPIHTPVGKAIMFSLSIVHGQEVNRGNVTRFSTDVRVVNSLAPINWGRSVHSDYYMPMVSSAVTLQARQHLEADALAKHEKEGVGEPDKAS